MRKIRPKINRYSSRRVSPKTSPSTPCVRLRRGEEKMGSPKNNKTKPFLCKPLAHTLVQRLFCFREVNTMTN